MRPVFPNHQDQHAQKRVPDRSVDKPTIKGQNTVSMGWTEWIQKSLGNNDMINEGLNKATTLPEAPVSKFIGRSVNTQNPQGTGYSFPKTQTSLASQGEQSNKNASQHQFFFKNPPQEQSNQPQTKGFWLSQSTKASSGSTNLTEGSTSVFWLKQQPTDEPCQPQGQQGNLFSKAAPSSNNSLHTLGEWRTTSSQITTDANLKHGSHGLFFQRSTSTSSEMGSFFDRYDQAKKLPQVAGRPNQPPGQTDVQLRQQKTDRPVSPVKQLRASAPLARSCGNYVLTGSHYLPWTPVITDRVSCTQRVTKSFPLYKEDMIGLPSQYREVAKSIYTCEDFSSDDDILEHGAKKAKLALTEAVVQLKLRQ